jgi:hypothetical protein
MPAQDTLSGITAGLEENPIAGGIAGLQAVFGIAQSIIGTSKANKLSKQLTAFSTPEEAYKILNATKSMAQQGFDAFT